MPGAQPFPLLFAACLLLASVLPCRNLRAAEPSKSLLARVAVGLGPGEWAELKTEGYTDDLLRDTRDGVKPVHWIYQYTNRICWNRPTQELYFMGAGHAARGKFVRFVAQKNAWERLDPPQHYLNARDRSGISHTYENSSIDEKRGLFLRRSHEVAEIERYDIASRRWLAAIASPSKGGHRSATCFFPELDALVRFENGSGKTKLLKLDAQAASWREVPDGPKEGYGSARSSPFIEYNPKHALMLFGGGHGMKKIFALDKNGGVTQRSEPPVEICSTHGNVFTVDPVSGEMLLLAQESQKVPGFKKAYVYDTAADSWRTWRLPPWLNEAGPLGCVATPVPDHGVVLFALYKPNQVWLYRHAPRPSKLDP